MRLGANLFIILLNIKNSSGGSYPPVNSTAMLLYHLLISYFFPTAAKQEYIYAAKQ